MKRRAFLNAIAPLVAAPSLIGLTRKTSRPIAGGFVDDGGTAGHRLRDRLTAASRRERRRVPIVIVGGGIAGLSAGWQLQRKGIRDFVLLELEQSAGGNSRSGQNEISVYPWAAHYVPVPNEKAILVRELFEELGVLRNGMWEERYLCFSPQERLFMHGQWHAGIEPEFALDAKGRADFRRLDDEIAKLRDTGQFTIPTAASARRDSSLDTLSMSAWLSQHGITSPAIRWYVDYCCRDDYGAVAAETSAWAGVHYFAAREATEPRPLTWPEGNAWISNQLIARLRSQIVTSDPALRIEREGRLWNVTTARTEYTADAVVFAAPSFLLPFLVPALQSQPTPLVYSPWLTANLSLDRIPAERGRDAPPSWDNVIYGSPSLGYVVATHQSLRTHTERTVWTYYWALGEHAPAEGRRLLQRRSWADWTAVILADLERPHADIRDCVSRIDIMRMGHAMVRPAVGFLKATEQVASFAQPGLYLGNSDVSGLSLFEEAQFRGVEAANGAMRLLSGEGA